MEIDDTLIRAAFEDARQDNYQHPEGLDPDLIAEECSELIDAVDEATEGLGFNDDEAMRTHILQESFVRVFEAGLAVGLEASQRGVEVTIQLDPETISGLVQRALSGDQSLKE